MQTTSDNIADWIIPADWQDYTDVLPCSYESRVGLSWMTRRELQSLYSLLLRQPEQTVLEIGTASGVSISLLAEAFPKGRFISVDDFSDCPIEDTDRQQHEGTQDEHRIRMWWQNAQPNQTLIVCPSSEIRMILQTGFMPYLVIVDGDHTEESTYRDLITAARYVHSRGTIVAHDYNDPNWTGVTLAVDKFCHHLGYTVDRTVGSLAFLIPGRQR